MLSGSGALWLFGGFVVRLVGGFAGAGFVFLSWVLWIWFCCFAFAVVVLQACIGCVVLIRFGLGVGGSALHAGWFLEFVLVACSGCGLVVFRGLIASVVWFWILNVGFWCWWMRMNLFVVGVKLLLAWWFTVVVRWCYIMVCCVGCVFGFVFCG